MRQEILEVVGTERLPTVADQVKVLHQIIEYPEMTPK